MAAASDDGADRAQAIALNRFGLGARPGEAPPGDPPGWLHAQLKAPPPPAATGLPDTAQVLLQTQQA
ncbi:MAG: hypothetical protein GAK30_01993 [Paracidovorax wautersii]|uniref:Uncharacterized protein n=1 Tax=Paracidovorax wautersii TaxID=1177982 RepID=A0A7V8FNU4_9BURK|nr:MAG: hypothetical protein GAK30_01993 [Paracidovorax wautersii]